MLPVPLTEGEPKRRGRVRFPGICEDATRLGITREHLYRVLTGKRKSKSLLKRYTQLKYLEVANPPAPELPVTPKDPTPE
jgi:hypothetical protein